MNVKVWEDSIKAGNSTYQFLLEKFGIKKTIQIVKDNLKEIDNKEIIDNFQCYCDDLGLWAKTNQNMSPLTSSMHKVSGRSIKKSIIFKIKHEDINLLDSNNLFVPFNNLFISSRNSFEYENELYTCGGFHLVQYEGTLMVCFFWSRSIDEGWLFQSYMFNKRALEKERICNLLEKVENNIEYSTKYSKIMGSYFFKVFLELYSSLIKKIEKKEYTSYKKWTPSGYEIKEIVYSHDVAGHRRHFWKDSGRFKIPLMSKEELESKGYGIDELVFRDGELRTDVLGN